MKHVALLALVAVAVMAVGARSTSAPIRSTVWIAPLPGGVGTIQDDDEEPPDSHGTLPDGQQMMPEPVPPTTEPPPSEDDSPAEPASVEAPERGLPPVLPA